jgi:hypothetical protein
VAGDPIESRWAARGERTRRDRGRGLDDTLDGLADFVDAEFGREALLRLVA